MTSLDDEMKKERLKKHCNCLYSLTNTLKFRWSICTRIYGVRKSCIVNHVRIHSKPIHVPCTKNIHISKTENGTKYSLTRRHRSKLDYLLTNSLTITVEIWSGSSKHNNHLKGVVSSFYLWNGDIWRLIWIMTSICSMCLTLSCKSNLKNHLPLIVHPQL